jgi:hypothetical protein
MDTYEGAVEEPVWVSPAKSKPEPFEEVQVRVGEVVNPRRFARRSNYVLLAYVNGKGEWRQFWRPSREPLVGVVSWRYIPGTRPCRP